MLLIVFSTLLFGAVMASAYALYNHLVTEKNPVALRLRELRSAHPGSVSASYGERPGLALELIARLGGFLPAREGRNALRTGLVCAGYREPQAIMIFLGSKVLCAAALPILWIAFGYMTARPLGNILAMSVFMAAPGFYLPSLF